MQASIDELVFRYLERVDAGEPAETVIAELARESPEQDEALRHAVRLLHETRLHPTPTDDRMPQRIGPFRLLRRLGAGGMGVVYAAEQDAPARRVALKLVRPDQLVFDGSRRRFEREIESVARLSHPGIAGILEMGEHDGVPWFSQELVIGAPVGELLAALPAHSVGTLQATHVRAVVEDIMRSNGDTVSDSAWNDEFYSGSWAEVALRIGKQVADALQHAHERGVLHRDVKPANILLTPGGRAVVVDFGLASLRGAARITQTGTQLGSLHYMAPEQIDGRVDEIGPRSDVYSLGVTLYELFTLRAPYTSGSIERLRGLILRGDAPAPHRLNPALPRDASVVCSCAMELERSRRYANMAALARDIGAVLARRPIEARPAGAVLRVVRWTERHPARAIAWLAAFLVFGVAPAVFGVQRTIAARDLSRVNRELEAALDVSDANLMSALEAIDRAMRWTAEDGLKDTPGMLALRVKVIDEALDVFGGLAPSAAQRAELVLLEGKLLRVRGGALADLGRHADAEASFARATTVLASAPTATSVEFARALFGRAQNLMNGGDAAAALPHFRASLDLFQTLAGDAATSAEFADEIALVGSTLAHALRISEGGSDEATRLLDDAVATTRPLVADEDVSIAQLSARCTALEVSARQKLDTDDLKGVVADYAEAAALMERALVLDPTSRVVRQRLSVALRHVGSAALAIERDFEKSSASLARAQELIEEIRAEHPDVPAYVSDQLGVLHQMASLLRKQGDPRGAYDAELEVARGYRDLMREEPGSALVRRNAAAAEVQLANYAMVDESRGEPRIELVLEHCERAAAILDGLDPQAARSHQTRTERETIAFQRGSAFFWKYDAEGIYNAIESIRALDVGLPASHFRVAFLWMRMWELSGADEDKSECVAWLQRAVDAGFANLALLEQSDMAASLEDERIDALVADVQSRVAGE